MSETSAAVTETPVAAPPATIHDAIDALFAEKEKASPPVVAAAPTEAVAETSTVEGEAPAAEGVPPVPVVPPKLSASDYAIQLARAKKKLALRTAAIPALAAPSDAALKRAAAIEAAGNDPIKLMEAAGVELAAAVRAHENEMAKNPQFHDPLAATVQTLAAKLAQFEAKEKAADEATAESSFLGAAEKLVAASGDKFEYVAAHGTEGLEVAKHLVLKAHGKGEVLLLSDALKMAESHYSAEADIAAKTKKLAAKFQTQTRKPGLPQQATLAAPAPAKQTKPPSVTDVINNAIDALLG